MVQVATSAAVKPAEVEMFKACAQMVTEVIQALPEKEGQALTGWLMRGARLRVTCDIAQARPARERWLVRVSVLRKDKPDVHVMTFTPASETAGPQVQESASVH